MAKVNKTHVPRNVDRSQETRDLGRNNQTAEKTSGDISNRKFEDEDFAKALYRGITPSALPKGSAISRSNPYRWTAARSHALKDIVDNILKKSVLFKDRDGKEFASARKETVEKVCKMIKARPDLTAMFRYKVEKQILEEFASKKVKS